MNNTTIRSSNTPNNALFLLNTVSKEPAKLVTSCNVKIYRNYTRGFTKCIINYIIKINHVSREPTISRNTLTDVEMVFTMRFTKKNALK